MFRITLIFFLLALFAFVIISSALGRESYDDRASTDRTTSASICGGYTGRSYLRDLLPPLIGGVVIIVDYGIEFDEYLATGELTVVGLLRVIGTANSTFVTETIRDMGASTNAAMSSEMGLEADRSEVTIYVCSAEYENYVYVRGRTTDMYEVIQSFGVSIAGEHLGCEGDECKFAVTLRLYFAFAMYDLSDDFGLYSDLNIEF